MKSKIIYFLLLFFFTFSYNVHAEELLKETDTQIIQSETQNLQTNQESSENISGSTKELKTTETLLSPDSQQKNSMISDNLSLSNFMNSSNIFDSQLFGNMQFNLPEQNSFSQMFSQITGIEVNDEQLLNPSSFGGNLDSGLINMQYQSLLQDMSNTATATQVSGQANTAAGLFTNSYGDIASKIQIKKATIPKGFNTNKMMKTASQSINKSYSKAMKSSAFKTAKNKVSINSAFDKAKNAGNATVSSSQLASDSQLSSLTSSLSSSQKSAIDQEYGISASAVNQLETDAKKDSNDYDSSEQKAFNKQNKDVDKLKGKKALTFFGAMGSFLRHPIKSIKQRFDGWDSLD